MVDRDLVQHALHGRVQMRRHQVAQDAIARQRPVPDRQAALGLKRQDHGRRDRFADRGKPHPVFGAHQLAGCRIGIARRTGVNLSRRAAHRPGKSGQVMRGQKCLGKPIGRRLGPYHWRCQNRPHPTHHRPST